MDVGFGKVRNTQVVLFRNVQVYIDVPLCINNNRFACGLAAGVMTAEELDILEDNVEQMRRELRAGDFAQATRLDFEFHQRILADSGNQAMFALVTSSADIFLESQKLPFIRPERAMETWQEHRKILKALARHAAGPAQKAMQ